MEILVMWDSNEDADATKIIHKIAEQMAHFLLKTDTYNLKEITERYRAHIKTLTLKNYPYVGWVQLMSIKQELCTCFSKNTPTRNVVLLCIILEKSLNI